MGAVGACSMGSDINETVALYFNVIPT
jgi:hypothetical protein